MLDTQIIDLIVGTPGMVDGLNQLSAAGEMVILCAHIQEDELAGIPDEHKRADIAKIVKEKVPTAGGVWDVSKWGEFTWGDGRSGGVSINDVRAKSHSHTKDALIGTTAAQHADVLVTEDRRLANRMRALQSSCVIWGFNQLKEYFSRNLKWRSQK